jgi:hypothetical protein
VPQDKDFSLHKKVAIARSGVYRYHVSELPNIDPSLIPVPKEYEGMTMFNVYRPAPVVEAAAHLFSSKPLVLGHTDMVVPTNWRELVVGHTGSDVEGTYDAALDEVVLTSDVTIGDLEAQEQYHEGVREVSPWYDASFSWRKTKTRDGQECQIVMDRIKEVNNVAMLPRGRGGRRIKVLDSERSVTMAKKSSIFHAIAKSLGIVKDEEGFVALFQDAVDKRASLTVEQLTATRDELSKVLDGFPENENRNLLSRCVFDLPSVKDEDEAVVKLYAEKVTALFGTLDAAADEEYEKISEATKKEAKKEGESPEQEQKEKEADEEKKTADKEPEKKPEGAAADAEFSEAELKEYAAFRRWQKANKDALKGGNVADSETQEKGAKDGENDLVDTIYQTAKGGKK